VKLYSQACSLIVKKSKSRKKRIIINWIFMFLLVSKKSSGPEDLQERRIGKRWESWGCRRPIDLIWKSRNRKSGYTVGHFSNLIVIAIYSSSSASRRSHSGETGHSVPVLLPNLTRHKTEYFLLRMVTTRQFFRLLYSFLSFSLFFSFILFRFFRPRT